MTPVRRVVALVGLAVVLSWCASCGASQRQKTISATLTATNTASAAFVAFDKAHQFDLVAQAKDRAGVEAALTTWREEQAKVALVFEGVYRAIATAATLDDDPSLAGMVSAALILSQTLHDMGVLK